MCHQPRDKTLSNIDSLSSHSLLARNNRADNEPTKCCGNFIIVLKSMGSSDPCVETSSTIQRTISLFTHIGRTTFLSLPLHVIRSSFVYVPSFCATSPTANISSCSTPLSTGGEVWKRLKSLKMGDGVRSILDVKNLIWRVKWLKLGNSNRSSDIWWIRSFLLL